MWFLRWSNSCLSFCWVVLITGDKGWHSPVRFRQSLDDIFWIKKRRKNASSTNWDSKTELSTSLFRANLNLLVNVLSVIGMQRCHEQVHRLKYHHRIEITGSVHPGKITVLLYLLSLSALGFYFPQLEREPPVSAADVRELPRDSGLLESTW